MTISKFWQLSIKPFFIAPQWEVAIIAKIFLGLFAVYMFASILVMGVGIHYIIEKVFPDKSTIDVISGNFLYIFDRVHRAILLSAPSFSSSSVMDTLADKKE